MGATPLSSHACRIRIQGELVKQVQTKAREDLQSCVANALLNALWGDALAAISGRLPIAAIAPRERSGRQIRGVRAGHQRLVAWVVRNAVRTEDDYTSGSCRLLEFPLHSFRDIQSSLASASDGNRRGHARCHAPRAQM